MDGKPGRHKTKSRCLRGVRSVGASRPLRPTEIFHSHISGSLIADRYEPGYAGAVAGRENRNRIAIGRPEQVRVLFRGVLWRRLTPRW